MGKKPLIMLTGGSGMVGRNILESPEAENYNFIYPKSDELNLLDFSAVNRYVSKFNPEFIVHAAGQVGGIQANIASPVDFLINNLDMGRNILLSARNAGVKKLLNLASSCMYPRLAPNPLSEEYILKGELEPTNEGYALAKILTLRLSEYINKEDETLIYKTFIPCNLYGKYDNFETAHSHLIPAIIHKVHCAKIKNDKTVEIWGDGNARREFMYAGDLAKAIFKAFENFEKTPNLLNIGTGIDYSIYEYYQTIADVIGWSGDFTYNLKMPVGMRQKLVSITRQSKWGWQPETSLRAGIKNSYDYYLEINN
jgi:GDP-L-fucose synthase